MRRPALVALLCAGILLGLLAWPEAGTPALPQAVALARADADPARRAAPLARAAVPAGLPASPFGPAPPSEPAAQMAMELRERNRDIDPARLGAARAQLAEMLLHQLELQPQARGGFLVREVAPGSIADRLGVQQGDLLYTVDNAVNAAVDEGSVTALTQQSSLALDVVRGGRPLHLALDLAADSGPAPDGTPGR